RSAPSRTPSPPCASCANWIDFARRTTMNDLIYTQRWPTPWERVQSLLACLEYLQTQFKEAIARTLGGSVARAVRDLARFLLGNGPGTAPREDEGGWRGDDGWPREDEEEREQGGLWEERAARRQQDAPGGEGWLSSLVALLLSWLAPLTAWAGTLLA